MTEVIVERWPTEPLTDEVAAEIIAEGSACRELHRLEWHRSVLSAERQELVCHLSSPDLESVRIALKGARRPMRTAIWSCTLRDTPGLTKDELARANVLVSFRFEQPPGSTELEPVDASSSRCLQRDGVRFLRTFVASDQRRVICLVQASDAESVRLALGAAQLPVERIWAFRQFHL